MARAQPPELKENHGKRRVCSRPDSGLQHETVIQASKRSQRITVTEKNKESSLKGSSLFFSYVPPAPFEGGKISLLRIIPINTFISWQNKYHAEALRPDFFSLTI
ncbi:MAG TPA: hypothetical protein DDW78_03590 [Treponema sp.]|nr:hypothetical protein [Treponema sp.]